MPFTCHICKRDIPTLVGLQEAQAFHYNCHIRDEIMKRYPDLQKLADKIKDETGVSISINGFSADLAERKAIELAKET